MTNELAKVIAEALRPEITAIIKEAMQAQAAAAQQSEDEEILTPGKLRKMLKISEATEWQWRKQGRLPFFRVNRLIYYRKAEVMAAIAPKK